MLVQSFGSFMARVCIFHRLANSPIDALEVESVSARAPHDGRIIARVLGFWGTAIEWHPADAADVVSCRQLCGRRMDALRRMIHMFSKINLKQCLTCIPCPRGDAVPALHGDFKRHSQRWSTSYCAFSREPDPRQAFGSLPGRANDRHALHQMPTGNFSHNIQDKKLTSTKRSTITVIY